MVDKEYKYPSGDSNILYIGCTIGEKKGKVRSAAFRFMHLKGNSDNKQNITLHKFYDNGEVIGLIISDCNGTSCKDIEKKLRYEFLNEFGALPIADGSSYSSKKGCFTVQQTVDDVLDEE